jgi:predicted nucleic acid-binding protein
MILIDSNIFIIDRFFKRDEHYGINREFVAKLPDLSASTSIYNLFEICGLASFNPSPEELDEWFYCFDQLYALDILYPRNLDRPTRQFFQDLMAEMFRLFSKKMTYVDAQILSIAEEHGVSAFITWNTKHFKDRTHISVLSPEEFLLTGEAKG